MICKLGNFFLLDLASIKTLLACSISLGGGGGGGGGGGVVKDRFFN